MLLEQNYCGFFFLSLSLFITLLHISIFFLYVCVSVLVRQEIYIFATDHEKDLFRSLEAESLVFFPGEPTAQSIRWVSTKL